MSDIKKKPQSGHSTHSSNAAHALHSAADSIVSSTKEIKDKAENLNKIIKEGVEDLDKKIQTIGKAGDKTTMMRQYNYLIFIAPIVLILLSFIPMTDWILQIVRFIIFCSMGFILFNEYRLTKRSEKVFFTSMALTILFNPIIPFFVPGVLVNIISLVGIGFLAYVTQLKNNKNTL